MSIPTWKNTLRADIRGGIPRAQRFAREADYEYFTSVTGGVVYRSRGDINVNDDGGYEGDGVTGWTTDDVERFSRGETLTNCISRDIVRVWREERLLKYPPNSPYSLDERLAPVYRKVLEYIAGEEQMHNLGDSSDAELAAAAIDGVPVTPQTS